MTKSQKTKPIAPQKPTPPPTQRIQESLKPTHLPQGKSNSEKIR